MARTDLSDPIRNFRFKVDFVRAGTLNFSVPMATAGFMSVSGLGSQTESIPYREGGDNTTTRKLPGQTDFPPLQFQRGLYDNFRTAGSEEWDWMKEIFFTQTGGVNATSSANPDYRCDIYIYSFRHPMPGQEQRAVGWRAVNAWPTSVAFSDLDAGGNGVAITQMSVVHEGLSVVFAEGQNDPLGFA
jgi:phage tail-like protein